MIETNDLYIAESIHELAVRPSEVGLPDDRYFTGLAGILLLIQQRPVRRQYFKNQCLKPVLMKINNMQ